MIQREKMPKFKKKQKPEGEAGIVVNNPETSFEKREAYTRLKNNILYLNADGNKKVIQIISSLMHEGKTTITCNLAVGLGMTDKKVVVVDADFRKPRTQMEFNTSIKNGLADYIKGTLTKEEIIKHTEYKNVDLITRGEDSSNSSLVFVSDKFKNLIQELKEEYDFVLVDCPPVLQVSDFINITPVTDGTLFVTAYGRTTRNQVSEAVKELRKANADIIGTVFSFYDSKKDGDYGYYNKKYGKYGYYGSEK